jgi:uncharacterized protein (TIGR03437 family)
MMYTDSTGHPTGQEASPRRSLTVTALIGVACLLLAPSVLARHDDSGCGTTPATANEALFLHKQSERLRKSRPAALAATPSTAGRDIGDVAIIEDTGGIVERLNQFNLDGASLTFTPSSGATTYRYAVGPPAYEAAAASLSTPLIALGDDDFREMPLPFAFPFFGASYNKVFVNSDGDLTFGIGENASAGRSAGRVTGGPPRIAALFDDLDPSRAPGSVRMFADATHAVFSWVAVPEYGQFGSRANQTFQVKLFADGRIAMAYAGVTPSQAVVGISPGNATGTSSLVSLRNDPPADYSGAVLERFGDTLEIDTVLVAQRFYQTHQDAYDYLVIYNNMNIDAMIGAVAYESTVRSSGLGYGYPVADAGPQYGSASRLKSVLNMGELSQYPLDPTALVPKRSASRDTPLTVLGHEAGHLFMALASVRDPNDAAARPMLGFGGVHWSFVFNSEASLDEGEQITDRGPAVSPRFLTTAVTLGYSPLDQYLMGFRAPKDVPDTFVVTDYSDVAPVWHPSTGNGFEGNRRNISVDDLIQAEGRRTPDFTVAQRRYRFAFILVTPAGQPVPPEDVQQVDTYRREFAAFFAQAANGNATADTVLAKSLKLSLFPAAGVMAGGTATATLTLQTPSNVDLTVEVRAPNAFARTPATVTIPAGAVSAAFTLTGARTGVEDLLLVPGDPSYETAYARVQVSDAAAAKLVAIASTPDAIVVRLSDVNALPYPGARIAAQASGGGIVTPAIGVTDAQGRATFRWTLASGPASQLRLALEAAPSVGLTFNAGAASPVIASVVNAASFVKGISPRSLETIFGANLTGGKTVQAPFPWPLELAGVAVTLNGSPLPLSYVSDSQINFYVPETARLGAGMIAMTSANGSASLPVTVTSSQPGIFAVLPTAPVQPGDYLEIYATGLGLAQTVIVYFGAIPALSVYAGPAPGFLGLDQVNVQVPRGLSGAQSVVIAIGNSVSNAIGITVR